MPVMSLTWSQVWARRLALHRLAEPAPGDRLAEVAGAVCGVHAQMLPAAELSLALRVAGATRQTVQDELWRRRGLVKTTGIRGTLHLFPAAELPLWLAALRAVPAPNDQRNLDVLRLDRDRLDAIVAAMGEALDGRRLTRQQLGDEVVARVGAWAGEEVFPAFGGMWPRWRVAIGAAAGAGVLCFGPNQGNQVTYVRVDQWAPAAAAGAGLAEVDEGAALAEVARRFLAAYGPATHREFAQWFNIEPPAALALFRSLRAELEEVEVEGWRAFLPAGSVAGGAGVAGEAPWPPLDRSPRLLPHFDCYLRGGHPRERLVPPPVLEAAARRGYRRADLTGPMPMLLVDGVVGGVWQRRRAGRRIELRVQPFRSLGARALRRLDAEAARVGEILGERISLSIGEVDARPHM